MENVVLFSTHYSVPVEVTHIILNACHDEFAGINSGFGFPVRFRVEGRINAGDKLQVIQDFTGSDFRNPRLIPVEAKPAAPVAVRFVRVTATVLAERQNDYMLALSELQIFDSTGKNVAHGKPVNAVDSIEAPVRWRKSNLTDGIWPQAEKPEAFVKLEKLQDTQDELLKHINTPERMQRKQHLEKARDKAAPRLGHGLELNLAPGLQAGGPTTRPDPRGPGDGGMGPRA